MSAFAIVDEVAKHFRSGIFSRDGCFVQEVLKTLGGSELGVAGIGASRKFYLARPPIDDRVVGSKPGKPDDHSLSTNIGDVVPLGRLVTLDVGSELGLVRDGSLVGGIVDVVGVKGVTEFACGDVVILNERG